LFALLFLLLLADHFGIELTGSFFMQILGGIVAAALIYCLTPGPLNIATTLSPGMNVVQGVFLEV
jgi:hypothetical protein